MKFSSQVFSCSWSLSPITYNLPVNDRQPFHYNKKKKWGGAPVLPNFNISSTPNKYKVSSESSAPLQLSASYQNKDGRGHARRPSFGMTTTQAIRDLFTWRASYKVNNIFCSRHVSWFVSWDFRTALEKYTWPQRIIKLRKWGLISLFNFFPCESETALAA